MIRRAGLAVAALIGALGIACLAAQEAPRIRVAPTIVAAPGSYVTLMIEVGPPEAVPPRTFLNVRGLPPSVALVDAHAIGPGSWSVSIANLPALKAVIPANLSGRSEVTISLIAMDGRLLSQAGTTLVIQGTSAGTAPAMPPAGSPAAPSGAEVSSPAQRADRPDPLPPPPVLAPHDRQRALALFAKGEELLAAGNVTAARLFYERAADAGLAEAALALAATFDPEELGRRPVVGGVQADPAAARRWYERARALGAREAEPRLKRLGGRDR